MPHQSDMNERKDMTTNQNRGESELDSSALGRVLEKALQGAQENVWPRQNAPQHERLIESAIIEYEALQLRVTSLEGALKGMLAAFEGKFSFNEMAAFEQVACNEARAALSPSGPQEA